MRTFLVGGLLASIGCFSMGGPEAETPAEPEIPAEPDVQAPAPRGSTTPTRAAAGKRSGMRAHLELPAALARGAKPWAQRSELAELQEAIDIWTAEAERHPKSLELATMLTRAHYFKADAFLRDDDAAYLETLDQAVRWGETALVLASPQLEAEMRAGARLPDAIKILGEEAVPALYWYARSLAAWSRRKGFAVLIGQKDNVLAAMQHCVDLDPEYFHGGPERYFGAFHALAPAFAGGDLDKSRAHFERALAISPDNAETKLSWASELAVKQQDRATFDRLLAEILATPDDVIPELTPETRVVKAKAKQLRAERKDLF